MTKSVAPQEDKLKLPASWVNRMLPRRGTPYKKRATLADPKIVDDLARKRADKADDLRAALDLAANEPFADAGRAYLDGAADPRGAAVIATLLCEREGRYSDSWLRPWLDAWIYEHGLAFAGAAAVEFLAIDEQTESYYDLPPLAKRILIECPTARPHQVDREVDYGGIAAARSFLAAATDDEYAAITAAVAAHRDTAAKRIAAMILFPDQQDWVLEAGREYVHARESGYMGDDIVWQSLTRFEQIAAVGIADVDEPWIGQVAFITLVANFGADALPIMIGQLADSRGTYFGNLMLEAISLLPDDEATAYLLEHLKGSDMFAAATKAADRFPLRTLRVAARLAPTLDPARRPGLAAIAALPDPALRVHLGDTERAALDELFASAGHVPAAEPEHLPALLVNPPWTRKRPKPVHLKGLEAPAESRLVWAEGEREAWNAIQDRDDHNEFWLKNFGKLPDLDAYGWRLTPFLAHGDLELAEPRLEQWEGTEGPDRPSDLQRILARFGERVVDRVLLQPEHDRIGLELPGPILNLDAARITAERLLRKDSRTAALRWLDRHGLNAVPYLVPDALGDEKDRRKHAETALNHLAVQHGAAAVVAAAERYGTEAAQAIAGQVDDDPLAPIVKVTKPGKWAVPSALPQVLLKGGERSLPVDSVAHLISVLMLAAPDYRYPGIDVVADACDHDSLRRFSTALFERWEAAGSASKDGWALTQLAHFADDAAVRRLTELIREWPGQNQHKRAVTGLSVLGAIGTDEALRAVQLIADKVKFKALKEEAVRQITRIAENMGLSREQLADRLVPTFGLDEEAALVVDYGSRKFTVAFDEHLVPFVKDEDGKPRKALPKPGKNDAEFAADAYKRFAAFKKELKAVAANQVTRMEAAMVAARTWTPEEFRRYFAEHALNRHLARRLVWLADVEDRRFGFRIAEDGSFSDVDDDAVELPEDAVIRVAHPVHLGPEQTKAWGEVLADYEILQPFDQLERPVMAFTEEELATGRLARFEGASVEIGRILGAVNRGWKRAKPEDAGVEPGIAHPLPGGGFLTVSLEPGIWAGQAGESPEQRFAAVRLCDREYYWWEGAEPDGKHPKDIDPATASEILSWLTRLTDIA